MFTVLLLPFHKRKYCIVCKVESSGYRPRPVSYLHQVQNSGVLLSTSVFKCDSTINGTLVTTMQQPSTNTLYKHKTGSRRFSESCFCMKVRKQLALQRSTCVNQTALQISSSWGHKSCNEINIKIYLLMLTKPYAFCSAYKSGLTLTSASSSWISESFLRTKSLSRCAGSLMSPQNVFNAHTTWVALVLYYFICICVIMCLCCGWLLRHRLLFFLPAQAFIFTSYFGNCLVCLGDCTWCACGCDCLGIPLRPVLLGERRILSLRKATKLHLWSDRGMKRHKQLLHRQPAVTMAVKLVALQQQRHTKKNIHLWNLALLCDYVEILILNPIVWS